MKKLYGWFVIGLFGVILFGLTLPSITFALLISAVYESSDSETRIRFGLLHMFWGKVFWLFIHVFLRIRIKLDIDEGYTGNHSFIVISNHRTALDHVIVNLAASHAKIKDLRWVLKASMRRAPVIGWADALMGSAFLARDDFARDMDSLEATAKMVREDRASIMIYPEGTRFRGVPDEGARFAHVREPKLHGFKRLVSKLPEHRVLCVTLDWGKTDNGVVFGQVGEFLGRHVCVRIRDIGRVSEDRAHEVLNTCWIDHERFLSDTN